MDLITALKHAAVTRPTIDGRVLPEPPAAASELVEVQRVVRRALPRLWQAIYTQVGNGGFGPGYGILGLASGATTDLGQTALSLYQSFSHPDSEDPAWRWPLHLLPICHWGCAIHSCVDLRTESAPIIRFDPNGHGPEEGWEGAWVLEAELSSAWLLDWIEGRLSFELPAG